MFSEDMISFAYRGKEAVELGRKMCFASLFTISLFQIKFLQPSGVFNILAVSVGHTQWVSSV